MTSTAARRLFPVAALVLAACGGSGPASPPTPGVTVAALIVSPAQLTIAAGASGTLAAETRSASGNALAGRAVSWRSSNAAVATVSDGVVTAVAPGTALIIGASEGATDTAEVTVTAAKRVYGRLGDPCAFDEGSRLAPGRYQLGLASGPVWGRAGVTPASIQVVAK